MKKLLLLALSSMMVSGVAVAQEPDNRSAWAKSQDMYVEPTLRITETTIPVTPEQAAQQNLYVQEVPAGTAREQTTTRVIGPSGQVIQHTEGAPAVVPVPATLEAVPQPVQQGGAPVQDLSRPVQ